MRGRNSLTKRMSRLALSAIVVLLSLGSRLPAQGNTWTARAPMPTPRVGLAAGVIDGILYAVGGANPDTTPSSHLGTLEAYDPKTDTWTAKAPMPTPRSFLAVGVVDGILYAVGGHNALSPNLATVEAYDPKTNTWSAKAPMPTGRTALAAAGLGGILYAVGGGGLPGFLTVLEAYDPKTNTWSTKAPMPTPRWGLVAAALNGSLHAVGGFNLSPGLAALEIYNPKTNTWSTGAPMPTGRGGRQPAYWAVSCMLRAGT